MSSIIKKLESDGLIKPPNYVSGGCQYETMMGSVAYGVSNAGSDIDVYGFCIPPKDMVFPHLAGQIQGFGRQKNTFEQWQQHHIKSKDGQKEYDCSIYSIVKFFSLCMENNPNMVDSLYTPIRCVLHSTKIGNMVRDNRKIFLHKGSWHKFKGYAYSQLNKMEYKNVQKYVDYCNELGLNPLDINLEMVNQALNYCKISETIKHLTYQELSELEEILIKCTHQGNFSKRFPSIVEHGYDVKFAYHVVRLLDEVEQILTYGDLDLERNREQLKSIRRGEWKIEDIKDYFHRKEKDMETLYINSKLQHNPDENQIKQLLLDCLEEYYGNLDKCIVTPDKAIQALKDIQKIIESNNII